MGKQKVLLSFHKKLYVGDRIKHVNRVKWKLVHGVGQLDVYVICICPGADQLEIMHSAFLKQQYYRDHPPFVVGIASGYDDALVLLEKIVRNVLNETGDVLLKEYFLRDASGM
jgi:hypothetical protein